MEKLINELILEVKNLNNYVKSIEDKLKRIEKGLHIKKDSNAIIANCNGGGTSEQITTTTDYNNYRFK